MMKNLQCKCENPAIILNPHLKDMILRYGVYYTPQGAVYLSDSKKKDWFIHFPYSTFRSIKKMLTSDELAQYYVIDEYGDEQPLYMQVPCGHCVLCREKKAQEWVSRAMAETQTSTNVPYFITLTYNDMCCPKNGVRKRAVQLFMKRLRINMSRLVGESVNLRFFLCAEYGSKTQRPHYHALLWNVPNLDPCRNIHDVMLQEIIQRSWSFMVSKKRYDALPCTLDKYGDAVYKYYDADNKRYRALYGYTKCSECNEHRVRYCMKYMRKESTIPYTIDYDTGEIRYKNDVFFLSSRRRGLGYDWMIAHLDEYRKNPSLLDVVLTDKFTGEKYSGCLPRYFKDIIAPPLSRVIPKDYRDAFAEYNVLYDFIERYIPYVNSYHRRVLEHYPTLYYHRSVVPHEGHSSILSDVVKQKMCRCDALEYYLLSFEYDSDILKFVPMYKHEHNQYVEMYANENPVSIVDEVARIKRRWLQAKQREQL